MRRPVAIRMDELIEAGIDVFTAKGYRNTRLDDVAAELKISAPALYNYVSGKDALFDLVVRRAAFPNIALEIVDFPVAAPSPGNTLEFITVFAQQRASLPSLEAVLANGKRTSEPAEELRRIAGELFDTLAFFRRGIKLIERCAEEWPEMRAAWFDGGRRQYHDALSRYSKIRQAQKSFWAGVPPSHAAKLIIETCAMYAIHRHYDPQPTAMTNDEARMLAVESLVRAFSIEHPRRNAVRSKSR